MSDTTLNRFLSADTKANRLAFTPAPGVPASGPSPGYLFTETATGDIYAWISGAWQLVASRGAAEIYNASVALTAGQMVSFASGGVILADDTDDTKPADGYVLEAYSMSTNALVRRAGVNTGVTGLTAGGLVYLGAAGAVTQTRPTSGGLQILGRATPAGAFAFNPQPASLL